MNSKLNWRVRFYIWLAWKLPKELTYWAGMRILTYYCTEKNVYSDNLLISDALDFWAGIEQSEERSNGMV